MMLVSLDCCFGASEDGHFKFFVSLFLTNGHHRLGEGTVHV